MRARWVYLAVMGAAGYTVFVALFYVAAHRTSALNLSIIQGAIPALVLIGARVFLGVRFSALQALGALITMLGVAVIAAQGDPARLAALAFNSGDVMMVVAAVLYAGYTIGLRQRPKVSGVSMLAAHGARRLRHLRSADDLGNHCPADSSGRLRSAFWCSPLWRLGRPSSRSSPICAGSN